MKRKAASNIYTVLVFIFLYMPIAVLILFSFNSSSSTGRFDGFSLRWYRELFSDAATMNALKNTLILAVLSSIIATVIGTLAAYGINKMKNRHLKGGITAVTNVPMMNPEIVTGISMMLLFVFVGGIINSKTVLGFGTVLIAHVTFNLPYVILSVMPKFKQMDKHLPEAALDLGCTPMQSFLKVELPQILPGIISGFIMAFTLSLDDFIISYFTVGSGFETLPIRIYSMTKKRVTPDMYALSTLIFVVIMILLLLSNISGDKEKKTLTLKQKKRRKIAIISTFSVIAATTLGLFIGTSFTEVVTVNVYNWGEYISDGGEDEDGVASVDVNKEFEKYYSKYLSEQKGRKIKVKVNYTTYASNEDLYAKLKAGAGGYDVIVPSDYMIERLIAEGLIQPIASREEITNVIKNYDYLLREPSDGETMTKEETEIFQKPFYDNGEDVYSVMYTYGVVGIIYNADHVSEEDIGGWDLLWNEKYKGKILQFNNARDAFGTAMYKLGVNVNDPTAEQWQDVLNELIKQKPIVQSYVMDEVFNKMESGEAWIAPYYAGDALSMIYQAEDRNINLGFYYPQNEEGETVTNVFADAMCIPADVSEEQKAHAIAYIDFMLSVDENYGSPAIANAEYIYYASPNRMVYTNSSYLETLDGDEEIIYAPIENNIDELFNTYAYRNLSSKNLATLNSNWETLKVESSSFNGTIYIISAVIAIAIIAFIVFIAVRRKYRRKLYWEQSPIAIKKASKNTPSDDLSDTVTIAIKRSKSNKD
ncbi:MAG: extracellular solute-binding protein [Clostridia bacterium]|nr:extracellular solute-binding protein [Clostridia bacterium]